MGTICFIPAKGTSRRIPKKNIKPFLGVPIIRYAIATALESDMFCEIVVSTDSQEVWDIAKGPRIRMIHQTCDANTRTEDNIQECIDSAQWYHDCIMCVLYPCAVFTRAKHLREAFGILTDQFNLFTQLVYVPRVDGSWSGGQFYMFHVRDFVCNWKEGYELYQWENKIAYEIPNVIDIDMPEDWKKAEEVCGL